jgi:hypothetical protein
MAGAACMSSRAACDKNQGAIIGSERREKLGARRKIRTGSKIVSRRIATTAIAPSG